MSAKDYIPEGLVNWPPIVYTAIDVAAVLVVGLLSIVVLRAILKAVLTGAKKKHPQRNYDTVITVAGSTVKYFVIFMMACQVLTIFGMSMESVLAVAGIGGVAIGFGARSLVEDVLNGASILFENQFKVGDTIEINGKSGVVESIGLRITTLRSFEGDVHILPNSVIRTVTNMSREYKRAVVTVSVPYAESIDKVLKILKDELAQLDYESFGMLQYPKVQGITEMDGATLTIRVCVDCQIGSHFDVERLLRYKIKTRFEQEGI